MPPGSTGTGWISVAIRRAKTAFASLIHPRHWVNPRRKRFWTLVLILVYTLAGFFLAPWVVRNQAQTILSDSLHRPVTIDKVLINPYALSLEARGFALREADGSPLAGFDRVYVNLQASSLFRGAWTFRRIELENPRGRVILLKDGTTNFHPLVPAQDSGTDTGEDGLVPLVVESLRVTGGELDITDHTQGTPFHTTIATVSLTMANLSTLHGERGEHRFELRSEQDIQLALEGTLQLNPLALQGTVTASGGYLPLAYRYFSELFTAELARAQLDAQLGYEIASTTEGLSATIGNLALQVTDALVRDKATATELLAIPRLNLSGLNLSWPAKTVSAKSFTIETASIFLKRNGDGSLNLQRLLVAQPAVPASNTEDGAASPPGNWKLALDSAAIKGLNLRFEDHSLEQPANLEITGLDFSISGLTSQPGARFPFQSSASMATGGKIAIAGEAALLPEMDILGHVEITDLSLPAAQPYLGEYAAMTLDSGHLSARSDIAVNGNTPFSTQGELKVKALVISETRNQRPLLGWGELAVDRFRFSTRENRLEIDELGLDKPYLRLRIAEDQTTNYHKLLVTREATEPEDAVAAKAPENKSRATAPPFSVAIGQITVKDGSGDFSDRSLPIPFRTSIASLEGEVSTIDSASARPARITLEGQVDDYGLARVRGTLLPGNPAEEADIQLLFRNVDMPDLTPYAIKFAGQEIAEGRLSLDLHYKMVSGKLKGDNNIVISDLKLGKKVKQEGALDLPLGLALALLKDAEGKIDIDLPVEGDTNNPEFRIGSIIGKALANLITKAVTAPFRLLGALVGMESNDFDHLEFEPGLASLTPPEKEKIAKLTQALAKRPQLGLRIPLTVDRKRDTTALRMMAFDMAVDNARKTSRDEGSRQDPVEITENLFRQAFPGTGLDAIRERHLVTTPGSNRKTLDQAAYEADLRNQLIAAVEIPPGALEELARERANAVAALVTAAGVDAARVKTGETREPGKGASGWISVKLDVENIE